MGNSRKLVLCGSDGTPSGKSDLYSILKVNVRKDLGQQQFA